MNTNCKDIDEIWYCFLEEFPKRELDQWKKEFLEEYEGVFRSVLPDEELLRKQFDEIGEKKKTCFFISDSSRLCKLAGDKGIPFLAFPDSKWEDVSFSYPTYGAEALSVVTPEFVEQIYRRFYHMPWDILETEHCLVRETTVEDTDALYEMYSNPAITLYTEPLYEDKEKERGYIRDYIKNIYEFYGFGIWSVIWKETGELIGRAGLTYREGFDSPEMGYVIAVPFQRQGIATEVCGAIVRYGFETLGFHEIRALFKPENTASERLCQKLGLQKDSLQTVTGIEMQQYIIRKESFQNR